MARISKKNNQFTSSKPTKIEQQKQSEIFRTALYVRLSVEDGGNDKESLESQIHYLQQFAADKPQFEVIGSYVDNGYSGTNYARPQFQKMIQQVQKGEINCIIVKDLSRLGRNYLETGNFLDKICPMLNLRVIAINDHYDTKRQSGNEEIAASITNLANDIYAKDISRKECSILQMKMQNGEYIGNYAPFGYCKDPVNKNHLIPDPIAAPYVQTIFALRAAGNSYQEMLRWLNDSSIPSPGRYRYEQGIVTNNNKSGQALLWNKHVLKDILSNVVYIGMLAQGKGRAALYQGVSFRRTDPSEWVVVENTHEPIISKAVFAEVQSMNEKAAEDYKKNCGKYAHLPKAVNPYGKLLVCGDCGYTIKLTRSLNAKKDKAYFTYKCSRYISHGSKVCTSKSIKQKELDDAVLATIQSHAAIFADNLAIIEQLKKHHQTKEAAADSHEVQHIEQQIRNKEAYLTGLYVDFKEGLLTQEEYLYAKKAYLDDIEALNQKRDRLAAKEKNLSKNPYQYWVNLIAKFKDTNEITKEAAEAFIEKIVLYDDKRIEIIFKYMDEFNAVLSEVKNG